MDKKNLVNNHSVEEDFPLSGGEEPDFKYPKTALIVMLVAIIALTLFICHFKGLF